MPHNKYQPARYPDGVKHNRGSDGKTQPGITNTLGPRLFSDNIVNAAPGFNAGMGRHVRAQQWADWHRNWEAKHVKKDEKGQIVEDKEGVPIVVG
mmetsp:Transcript_19063/g.47962  ORF Transcript_19063/g.47962 Transcript_19063/m.47962 type:complete len:95 (+) Transcript_19063:529-813(+)